MSAHPEISDLDLWKGMMHYYNMGLSMLWCRMETEIINGKEYKPKTPLGKWRSAQEVRFTEEYLSKQMHMAKVRIGIQVVCGKVSGNLEVIDIDVKHWSGIDARYFTEIKALYPELFNRLLINRTMSGGFQIWYRCEEPINEGSKKLCRQKDNPEAGIETRGEGGLAVCPPTPGYTVHQNREIPTITRAERDALIQIARQFDETVKPIVEKREKKYDAVYSENPFDHYNSSPEAENILLNHGWTEHSNTSRYVYFTKPDATGKKVSASFGKERRFYTIFTSSTELENDKSYSPSSLLIEMEFNGDGKEAFKFLREAGFGKYQEKYEEKAIKAYAQHADKELPPNFSPEAKDKLKVERAERKKKYPHGTFWDYDDELDSYTISLTDIIAVANGLGVARYNDELVHVEDPFFRHIQENECQALFSQYIKEDKETFKRINDSFLKTWKQYAEFLSKRTELREILKENVLKSSESIHYKVFRNLVLEITKDEVRVGKNCNEYGKLICLDDVIDFDFKRVDQETYLKTKYCRYLSLAISNEVEYTQKCIGYLCHDFKTRGKGHIISALEGMQKGKGGGSGKGMFFEMLGDPVSRGKNRKRQKKWTTLISISGQQIEKGEAEMLQMWNGERIVHFSDVPKNLNLSGLKDVVTDGGSVKKLYKDVFKVEAEDYPNVGLSSQWGVNTQDDPGVRRRVRILTFTSHFNVNHEIRDEFGGSFPYVWDDNDWLGYYNYIADGIRRWLHDGKIEEGEESDLLWEKNFDHMYGMGRAQLRDWIADKVDTWVDSEYIKSADLQGVYEKFCLENNIKREMSIPRLHEAIEAWCIRFGFEYQFGVLKRIDGERARVSVITRKGDKPKVDSAKVESIPENKQGDLWDKVQEEPKGDESEKTYTGGLKDWDDDDPPF
jgi:hypothetical protein